MSRSEIVKFAKCPDKYINTPIERDNDTPATTFGKLVECLSASPEDFDALFAVESLKYNDSKGNSSDWTYKSSSCRAWRLDRQNEGFTVVSPVEKARALMAVASIKRNVGMTELLEISRKQVHVIGFWHDKETGLKIPIQCLLDLVPDKKHPVMGKWLSDFKTTRNGDPSKWAREVDDQGYDVQAALSMDMYRTATGEDRTDWVHAVVENEEPFHVVNPMPAMTTEFIQWGREKYQGALRYYAQCLATNKWPSYQVFGLHAGLIQLIGPESLWSYKQYSGQGSLQAKIEYDTPPQRDEGEVTP
jgi:exodeoxyribonuclease VIII